MKSREGIRLSMSPASSYVSIAGTLKAADEGIRHVMKMGVITKRPDNGSDLEGLEIVYSSDHVLLDFKSLVASSFDATKIVRDCEFVRNLALANPGKLEQMVQAYIASPLGFEKAAAIVDEIGFTEEAAVAAGGGAAWIPILIAIAIMAKACQDAKNGNPQGKPRPAQ